jgi:hypothetical protein
LFAQEVMQDPDETFAKKQALRITALLSETRECSGQRESSSVSFRPSAIPVTRIHTALVSGPGPIE